MQKLEYEWEIGIQYYNRIYQFLNEVDAIMLPPLSEFAFPITQKSLHVWQKHCLSFKMVAILLPALFIAILKLLLFPLLQ